MRVGPGDADGKTGAAAALVPAGEWKDDDMALVLITSGVIGALGLASKSNTRAAREHVLNYGKDWRDQSRAGE